MLTKQNRERLISIAEHAKDESVFEILAHEVLRLCKAPKYFLAGPITTGGFENKVINSLVLQAAFNYLEKHYEYTFFQTQQMEPIFQAVFKTLDTKAENCNKLVDKFFGTILRSTMKDGNRFIKEAFLLPLWTTSDGAKIEHDIMLAENITCNYQLVGDYRFLDDTTQVFLREAIENRSLMLEPDVRKRILELLVGASIPEEGTLFV